MGCPDPPLLHGIAYLATSQHSLLFGLLLRGLPLLLGQPHAAAPLHLALGTRAIGRWIPQWQQRREDRVFWLVNLPVERAAQTWTVAKHRQVLLLRSDQ